MKPALWLARREFTSRRFGGVVAVAVISIAVAFCAGIELLSRAKEAAIAAQIDQIGPALRIIPYGKTARDLARFELASAPFDSAVLRQLRRELGGSAASIEGRLLLRLPLGGRSTPVVGLAPNEVVSPFEQLQRLEADEIALGAELGSELGASTGDVLTVQGTPLRVIAVLPTTASPDDSALFLHRERLQALFGNPEALNELRIFPAPGADLDKMAASLKAHHPEMNVIETHRGETAEKSMNQGLRAHRHALYMTTAAVIAASLFIWSYVNANERLVEMATVVAIGGTGTTVLTILVARAVLVGFVGAVIGFAMGASIALVQDFGSAIRVMPSLDLAVVVTAGTAVLSGLGALPPAVLAGLQNHVQVLQDA